MAARAFSIPLRPPSRHPLPRRLLRPLNAAADDHGAAALDYAAVVLLACALGTALFGTSDYGQRILAEIRRAVCAALDLGDCADRPGDADRFLPEPCTTDAQQISSSVGVSVAARQNGQVRIAERVDSDGTAEVALTHRLHGTADAPSPLRWGADLGPLAEADAGLAAGVHGGASTTHVWEFSTEREAARFRERVARAEHLESIGSDSGAFDAIGSRIVGFAADRLGSDAVTLPPPDRREVSVKAGLHLAGDAGASLGVRSRNRSADGTPRTPAGESPARPGGPRRPGTGLSPGSDSGSQAPGTDEAVRSGLDLLHLVSAGAEGDAVLTESRDGRSGTVSRTVGYEFAEAGEVGPLVPDSVLSPEDARDRLTGASLTTTRDSDTGELVEVAIETVNADGDSGHVVGTARLEVTDANRAAVRRRLDGREPLLALTFLSTTARPKDVTSAKAESSDSVDEFDRLLYSEGTYSSVRYATDSRGREFSADATLSGLSFGGATGWESATRTAIGARYLGGPGPAGRRELIAFEECTG
ncbi:hypothetical protein LP52_03385 [Streptomonospora alba]|uniref:Uncharacterized protein n=1 Tax=Streptomonospora alba TaxID=183763 RepID=A0A0C2FL18_9ACTN|nr:hypothetical protein [Streptomonospora alba]KII00005.1 hypothetical protein LP52_03385 [Streptomonospora alba]